MKKIILYICFLAAANIALAQQHIAIVGATAHLGTGVVIENSLILIKDGKIEEVTTAERPVPKIYRFIDAKGKHVYPGAIAAATRVGLEEIEAVRATLDYQEVGSFNPHIRSLIAYNTDSKIIPTLRFNGVLTVQSIPFGGWISGTSSVFRLNGWNWQDAVLATDEGLWLNWPNTYNNSGWWAEPGTSEINKEYDQQVQEIEDFFATAKAYQSSGKGNIRLAAMKSVFEGKQRLYVYADKVKEIVAAVKFAKQYQFTPVIVGGNEADQVADFLAEQQVPVIIKYVHRLPSSNDLNYDAPYKLAAILTQKKVLCAISIDGSWQQRNLFFHAGTAAAFGLSKEDALSLVSYNVAKILGIDQQVGSIQKGLSATLLICNGDVLDMKSSKLAHVFIDGKEINLDDMQQQLYQKFRNKYIEQGLIKNQ